MSTRRFHLYCPIRVDAGALCGSKDKPSYEDADLPDCLDCYRASKQAGDDCPICKEALSEHN